MGREIMLDRVSKWMTYGGACAASGCGAASGGTIGGPTMSLADTGMVIGILVGLFGAAIQFSSWLDKRDTKKREDAFRETELHYLRLREERERIDHEAMLTGVRNDRRQVP